MSSRQTETRQARPGVLVLGGAGFIGRHAAQALLASGYRVLIGSRRPRAVGRRLPAIVDRCELRDVHMERLLQPADWATLVDEVDVVVNCVGILRQSGTETYERVHHHSVAALAAYCAGQQRRLIHVSALGLSNPVRSRFLLSKRRGEAAVRHSGGDWWLVRPSLLEGEGGYGARWLQRVAGWPLHVLPGNAAGRIAVFDAAVLGQALAALVSFPAPADSSRRVFELGGEAAPTLAVHLADLRSRLQRAPALRLQLPAALARGIAHVCDLLHLTPFSFGHYELLKFDNVPQPNRLQELLGVGAREREPSSISAGPIAAASDPPLAAHPLRARRRA